MKPLYKNTVINKYLYRHFTVCIYTIRIKAFSIPYNIRITIQIQHSLYLDTGREKEIQKEDRRSFACLFRTQMSVFSMLVIKVISSDLSWGHQVTGHWLAVCLLNTVIWRSVYRMSCERCLCFYCQLDSTNQSEELCCEERVGSELSRRSTPSVVGDLRDAIAGVIQNLLQTDKHTAEFVRRFRYEMHIQTDRREKTSTFSYCLSEMSLFLHQVWRNVALHHLLSNGCSAVNGCRQNESPNSW